MDNQVPNSQVPGVEAQPETLPQPPFFDIEAMKAQARELAIKQAILNGAIPGPQPSQPVPTPTQPKVVYVRRNLTVAELIVVFGLACALVAGVPNLVRFIGDRLPQVEIKVK